MTVCLEYSVFCFPGWCGSQHDDLGSEVVRRKLVEERAGSIRAVLQSYWDIRGSKSEGATSPHVGSTYVICPHFLSPHVHLVCLDSVCCCMFGQPCCQTQQQGPSSHGGNPVITALCGAGEGTLLFVPSVVTLNTSITAGFSNFKLEDANTFKCL